MLPDAHYSKKNHRRYVSSEKKGGSCVQRQATDHYIIIIPEILAPLAGGIHYGKTENILTPPPPPTPHPRKKGNEKQLRQKFTGKKKYKTLFDQALPTHLQSSRGTKFLQTENQILMQPP